jgi:pimeloyl-ACP methyl ester carboxylesterase
MARFSRGDVDVYYEIHGEGAPLMMIAGLASDSQSWQPIIADLASHYRLITVDNRGAGRTTPQDAPVSIRAMADDCVALLDFLGLPSVHVLGHSMGGFRPVENQGTNACRRR